MASKAEHIEAAETAIESATRELTSVGEIGHRPGIVVEYAAVAQAHAAIAAAMDA